MVPSQQETHRPNRSSWSWRCLYSFLSLHLSGREFQREFITLYRRISLPTRPRIRRTFSGSARRARSSKYSSVRIAETFSASASVIGWLSATPSDSAALRASASRVWWHSQSKITSSHDSPLLLSSLGRLLPPALPPSSESVRPQARSLER